MGNFDLAAAGSARPVLMLMFRQGGHIYQKVGLHTGPQYKHTE